MQSRAVTLLLSLSLCGPTAGRGFDGNWKVVFSCKGATGVYAERCIAGQQDHFELEVWSSASRICATHAATAYLGSRIDEDEAGEFPTMLGRKAYPKALLSFQSSWGGKGHASISEKGGKLYWQILDKDEGESWLPQTAILIKQAGPSRLFHPPCPE